MWKKGPFIVYWNITAKCNMNCFHCHAYLYTRNELSTEECIKIVKMMKKNGVGLVIIAGGEPLLRDDIWKILNELKENGLHTIIVTNGFYLEINTAQRLKNLGIREVQISIDSGVEEIHDSFRGCQGSYQKAMQAIRNCIACGVMTSVNTVLVNENILEIEKLGYQLKAYNVNAWRITIPLPKGNGKTNYDQLVINNDILISKINILLDKFDNIVIDDPLCVGLWGINDKLAKECGAAKIVGAIEANGDVKPCVFFENKYGNILVDNLETIWGNSEMESVRNMKPCNNQGTQCFGLENCKGGCKAYLQQNGNSLCIKSWGN